MKNIIIISLILALSLSFVILSVKAEETTTTIEATTTTVSPSDGSLVPLSVVGRVLARLRAIFSRDPIQRTEATLELAGDNLWRLKPNLNPAALEKALANYNQAIEKLKTRLEELKETSNNPNLDTLLNKLTDLELRHQEIFNNLLNNTTSTSPLLEQVRNRIHQEIIPLHLRFENQEEMMHRLQESLEGFGATSTPAGEFRQLQIMETLRTQLEEMNMNNVASSTQEQVQQLRNRLENQIQQRINTLEKQGFNTSTINQILEGISKPVFKNLPSEPPPQTFRGNK
ncbi:MAG: hypothetical protein GYA31_01975 [Parcubacteria group bacterium]|nr:hypothetical protein [Parcubacteria group bacterium]